MNDFICFFNRDSTARVQIFDFIDRLRLAPLPICPYLQPIVCTVHTSTEQQTDLVITLETLIGENLIHHLTDSSHHNMKVCMCLLCYNKFMQFHYTCIVEYPKNSIGLCYDFQQCPFLERVSDIVVSIPRQVKPKT